MRPRIELVMWPVVTLATVAVARALPDVVRFLPDAPGPFWAMAIGALLVDIPLFGVLASSDQRVRSTFSIIFVFAIYVLWGPAQAIVVQTVAGAVTAIGQRYMPREGAYFVARLVLAPAVAALLIGDRRSFYGELGTGLTTREILEGMLLVAIWLAVLYGLLALARSAVLLGGLRAALIEMRWDVVRSVASLPLGGLLLTTLTGWWPVLAVVPVLVWNWLTRSALTQEQRLRREPASGLLNRQGLIVGLAAMTAKDLGTPKEPQPYGLILVRLPSVMAIAENLGRDLSEQALTRAAGRLVDIHGRDCVGHLSAEDVIVLVPGLTESNAVGAAEAAVDVLRPAVEVDDVPLMLGPVAGVALSPQHGDDLNSLLLKAGLAASAARRRGGRARLYEVQALELTERRLTLLRDLYGVLRDPARRHEVAVHYQPQVELATDRLVGVEALVRWTHPEWGAIRPDELLEAVQQTQVVALLTRHVLSTMLSQLRRWNDDGVHVHGAMNVTVQDLQEPGFVAELGDTIRACGAEPTQLTIEITEHMLMTDSALVTRAAHEIAGLGVGLSLDDFGNGHASLRQMRDLPLTQVKIDMYYVQRMLQDPADRAIVTSVHQLAQALQLGTVAEGVENGETAEALAALGGMVAQGYHLGRPMDADAFQEWLRSRRAP